MLFNNYIILLMDISKYKPNGTFLYSQEDEQLNNLYNDERCKNKIEIKIVFNNNIIYNNTRCLTNKEKPLPFILK